MNFNLWQGYEDHREHRYCINMLGGLPVYDDQGHQVGFNPCGPVAELPYWAYVVLVAPFDILRESVTRLTCRVRGHKWISTDYATPDSGAMGGYCERCYTDFHHQLY